MHIELFSGKASVTAALRKQVGDAVLAIDIHGEDGVDLGVWSVASVICAWIRAGLVASVWAAPPCSTWSNARRPALRFAGAAILGRTDARPDQSKLIEAGNATASTVCRVIAACLQSRCPVIVENPHTSLLWQHPRLAKLADHRLADKAVVD